MLKWFRDRSAWTDECEIYSWKKKRGGGMKQMWNRVKQSEMNDEKWGTTVWLTDWLKCLECRNEQRGCCRYNNLGKSRKSCEILDRLRRDMKDRGDWRVERIETCRLGWIRDAKCEMWNEDGDEGMVVLLRKKREEGWKCSRRAEMREPPLAEGSNVWNERFEF